MPKLKWRKLPSSSWHRRFLWCLWFGILGFAPAVAVAWIQSGHVPTRGSPDPRDVAYPALLFALAGLGWMVMSVSVWLLLFSSLYRMFSPQLSLSVREWILTSTGIALALALLPFHVWYVL